MTEDTTAPDAPTMEALQAALQQAAQNVPLPPPGLNPQEASLLQILDWASDDGKPSADAPHWQQLKHLEGLDLLSVEEISSTDGNSQIVVSLKPGGAYERARLVQKEIALLAAAADAAVEEEADSE